jgi:tetratricopeptide (TPR) repeat protein
MKIIKIISIQICLLFIVNLTVIAQKDKMPSKAEMEAAKKNLQQVINELKKQSPELAAEMEKKLKEIDIKLSKMNSHGSPIIQSQDSLPKLNKEKIESIPKTILTSQQRIKYLSNVIAHFKKNMGSQLNKTMDSFYIVLQNRGYKNVAIFNYGISLYPLGRTTPAFLLMLKSLSVNPANTYMQYNFASMLINHSGAHMSLPILQSLNKDFPDFPDLLNNIGQAWYALGDVEKAKTSFNECLGFSVSHTQANTTMCLLNFKEGNMQAVKKNLKQAIKTGYNSILEKMAKKTNHKFDKSVLDNPPYKTMYNFKFIDQQKFPSGDDDKRIIKEWFRLQMHWGNMSRHFYEKQKEIQKILDTSKKEVIDVQIKILNSNGSTFTAKQSAQLEFSQEELEEIIKRNFELITKLEADYKKRKEQLSNQLNQQITEIQKSHSNDHNVPKESNNDPTCCTKFKNIYRAARSVIEADWERLIRTKIKAYKNHFLAEEKVFQFTPYLPLKVLMLKQLYYQRMHELTNDLSITEQPPFLRELLDCESINKPLKDSLKNMPVENLPGDCKEGNESKRSIYPFVKITEMGCNGDQSIEIDFWGFHSTLDFEGFENVTIGVGLSASTSGTGIDKALEEMGIKELLGGHMPSVGFSEDIYITVDNEKGITDIGVKAEAGGEIIPVNRDLDAKIGIKSSFITGTVQTRGSGILNNIAYNWSFIF